MAGANYNDYTIQLGTNQGASGGGAAGYVAVERKRMKVQASRSITDNPHWLCLCLSPRKGKATQA
eukprot:scaffold28564_cov16-Tisochrysis_lutea.AAC.1